MMFSLSKELLTFCVMFADLKCCSHLPPFSEKTWYLQVKIPSNSEFLLALGTIFPKVPIKKMSNSQPQTNNASMAKKHLRLIGATKTLPWQQSFKCFKKPSMDIRRLREAKQAQQDTRILLIQGLKYYMSLIYFTMIPDNCKIFLCEQQRRPPKYLRTSNPSISSSCMASASIPAMNCRANTAKMIKMILGEQEGNMELEAGG